MGDSGPLVKWSIRQIAARDKKSPQAVSKKVAKLIADGHELEVERDARGRVARISLAHYDHHLGFFGNPARAQVPQADAPEADPLNRAAADSRDEAQRQEAWLNVARKKLDHDKEIGALVRADIQREALRIAGRRIQREIARLPNRADDLALAVSKEGEHGARLELRKIAAEIGNAIADALAEVAETAPEHDEMLEKVDS